MHPKTSPMSSVELPLALLLVISIFSMQLVSASLASFVIGRPNLFHRAQVQSQSTSNLQQQQQQMPQPQASQQQQSLLFASNNMMPSYGHFGLNQQADLLRVGPARASQMHPQQLLQPDFSHLNPVNFDAQAAGYYKPTIEPLVNYIPAQNLAAVTAQARGIRLEPSQTEIVDKIERHIGRQIDQSLSGEHNVAASGYENDHEHTNHHHQPEELKEKDASASHPEEAEEIEEPMAEKQHHEEKKPAREDHQHQHQHQHEHHEHQPMEAFEVHHKKGGKSFQYFHQGHSS